MIDNNTFLNLKYILYYLIIYIIHNKNALIAILYYLIIFHIENKNALRYSIIFNISFNNMHYKRINYDSDNSNNNLFAKVLQLII